MGSRVSGESSPISIQPEQCVIWEAISREEPWYRRRHAQFLELPVTFLWLLKQTTLNLAAYKVVLSWYWKPEVQNRYHWAQIKVSVGLCSLRRLDLFCSLPLATLCGCQHSLACGHTPPASASAVMFPSPFPCQLSFYLFLHGPRCLHLRPTWIRLTISRV